MNETTLLVQRGNNQRLTSAGFRKAVDVVRWFGAMQAQDFNAAKWALALRMRGTPSAAAVEQDYNDGRILRTHVMRPTWHFVAPEDIRWLLELTAPRVNLKAATNYRKLELDASTCKRSNKILAQALEGGKHLTRTGLKMVLNRAGIPADDTIRMAHIMLRAELDGVVCSGRRIGKQFTYALLHERVPPAQPLSREEALAKLTLRYFSSHGPATLPDFVWWSGLTGAQARQGLALIDSEIEKAVVNERVYYFARAKSHREVSATSAYLLPIYDEYNVAYKDRQITVDFTSGEPSSATWGMLGPNVMLAGKIVGAWKATREKHALTILINAGRPLTKLERSAIAKAAERYATFAGITHHCLTFAIQTC